jgi:sporulation protein YlmC with PRC-barrel domain
MLVPFGTKVVDCEGEAVGTVRHVVLQRETRQVDGLVVHQGVRKSRDLIVPIGKVAGHDGTVRLTLTASELDSLPLFHAEALRPMPDHWRVPAGFDERDLFLVGGDAWTEAALPSMETSTTASGTPAYVHDKDSTRDPDELDIGAGMAVYDDAGHRVGDVESVSVDPASRRIAWIVVGHGHLLPQDGMIPASLIESVTDRITLKASTQTMRRLGL